MTDDTLIKVDNVSKKFCRNLKRSLWYGVQELGRELINQRHDIRKELRPDEFWSLKDVSFEVKRGECLGLIGHNGAGKTTLLRILNGLIKPDAGRIEMHGRVGALVTLNAGFNPVLTGRENSYVFGSILGLSKKEIDSKIDAIIDFSEIGSFIDSPVQIYSSGMQVRLGFSIATQMNPDILLIDEVLAVGDMQFVLKCFNHIDKVLSNTAVIFVSHSMPMVSRISTGLLHLKTGHCDFIGTNISEGISKYLQSTGTSEKQVTFNENNRATLIHAELLNNRDGDTFNWLDDITMHFTFEVTSDIPHPAVSLFMLDCEEKCVAICTNNNIGKTSNIDRNKDKIRFSTRLALRQLQLSNGKYSITFGLAEDLNIKPILRVKNAINFQIISDHVSWAPFVINGEWNPS